MPIGRQEVGSKTKIPGPLSSASTEPGIFKFRLNGSLLLLAFVFGGCFDRSGSFRSRCLNGGRGRRRGDQLFTEALGFFQTGFLAAQAAQVEQARAADRRRSFDLDLLDERRED